MATFRVPCQKHVIFPNLKFEIKFLAEWLWLSCDLTVDRELGDEKSGENIKLVLFFQSFLSFLTKFVLWKPSVGEFIETQKIQKRFINFDVLNGRGGKWKFLMLQPDRNNPCGWAVRKKTTKQPDLLNFSIFWVCKTEPHDDYDKNQFSLVRKPCASPESCHFSKFSVQTQTK